MLLAAGGTGGHIFPALALGEELRNQGIDVVWAGRQGAVEEAIARSSDFQFEPVEAGQIAGKGLIARLRGVGATGAGFLKSVEMIRRLNPDAVVAAGGFVSAPVLLASLLTRTKFFLLEQNCIPGRVTRFFSPYAEEVFLTFPLERQLRGKWRITGTPLRRGIVQKSSLFSTSKLDDWFPGNEHTRTVLVLGGSQGARVLNLAALDLAATLSNVRVVIVTGRRDYNFIRALVRSRNCELVEWTDRPEELYLKAELAITRAGGLVISELLAFGIPMVVVPFPYAADRHQEANARYVGKIGAGIVLEQSQLSGLISLVQHLLSDREKLRMMARKARAAAKTDAAAVIVQRIMAAFDAGGV